MASPHTATRRFILQKTRHNSRCRDILPVPRFQVLFHSPSGVLFTFPSRYFCTIGSLEYSALDRGRPGFGQGSSCPALLRYRIMESASFRLRDCHPLRCGCPAASAMIQFSSNSTGHPHAALQPRSRRFGLLRFRSPLLAESLLISFPRVLRWFTSSRVAPPHYFIHACGVRLAAYGLPHSAVRGSPDMCSYPRLFAAYRGLLRLQAPRHPPWTYFRLTILPLPPLHSRTRMHSSYAAGPRLQGGLLHSFNFYC